MARNRAEELMHDDEDDGEFHDAEESELESDGIDDDEDTGETKREGFPVGRFSVVSPEVSQQ